MDKKKIIGLLAALGAVAGWAISFVCVEALQKDFSSQEVLFLQYFIAFLVLLPLHFRAFRLKERKDEWLFIGLGLCGFALCGYFESCAVYYMSAANMSVLDTLAPIVTAAMVMVATRKNLLTRPFVIGALIAFAGAIITCIDGILNLSIQPIGTFAAFLGFASWGLYSIFLDKLNDKGYPQLKILRRGFFWALPFMLFRIFLNAKGVDLAFVGLAAVNLDGAANCARFAKPMTWVNVLTLAVFSSALTFLLWGWACKAVGTVKANLALYLTPVFGVLFAALFLGEQLTPALLVGGAVILAGVIISNKGK
ncbi:MAG: DMT family transporter [bacterium]|nr:DMT family transporter [Candidatus Colisoma equi]